MLTPAGLERWKIARWSTTTDSCSAISRSYCGVPAGHHNMTEHGPPPSPRKTKNFRSERKEDIQLKTLRVSWAICNLRIAQDTWQKPHYFTSQTHWQDRLEIDAHPWSALLICWPLSTPFHTQLFWQDSGPISVCGSAGSWLRTYTLGRHQFVKDGGNLVQWLLQNLAYHKVLFSIHSCSWPSLRSVESLYHTASVRGRVYLIVASRGARVIILCTNKITSQTLSVNL